MCDLSIKRLKTKQFQKKPKEMQELYFNVLKLLNCFGYPIDKMTNRALEKTIGAFLALCNVFELKNLSSPEDLELNRFLSTREIIEWENKHLNEEISPGSYDDIRRKDLKILLLAEIVLKSDPNAAANNPKRGYGISPAYSILMKLIGQNNWEDKIFQQLPVTETIKEKLARERDIDQIPVEISSDISIEFSSGDHNILQKKIIEEFLPRFGYKAELLYVGDTTDRYLYLESEKLAELNMPEISHGDLPDILAFSQEKKWIYLIEAVHSSGHISETRLLHLKNITKEVKHDIVFVTAFLDAKTFRKFSHEIAWETEVWIADNPDHMIHFNGDKFMGPYS
jgi:type II restriction enzyme